MPIMRFFLYLSVMHLSIFRIEGHTTGAGSCHSGSAIPNYSPHPDVSSWELAAAGINVFIGYDQLFPSEPYSLQYGETEMNVLSIQSSSGFAGFLMRGCSSTGLDAPNTVTPIIIKDTSPQIEQYLSFCENQSPQASGVKHINNDMKTYVQANIANPVVDVIDLEVTVMVNANEYYYSKFTVDFIEKSAPTSTIASSSNPSSSISTVPSLSPSAIASTAPSSPTIISSATPTSYRSMMPSVSPSTSPTSSSSQTPFISPSMTPSGSPVALVSATLISTIVSSSNPTLSLSKMPSLSPSAIASTPPSSSPTSSISTVPSPSPSTTATIFPSSTPTVISSLTQTSYHTMMPSVSSSEAPTSYSSQTPSISPSITPSGSPVALVSATPTAKVSTKSPVNIINPSPSGPPLPSPTSSSGYYLCKLSGNGLTNVFWGFSILFITGFV